MTFSFWGKQPIFRGKLAVSLRDCNNQPLWRTQVSNGKKPGYLLHIGDYTAQLYRDYNKPFQGSLRLMEAIRHPVDMENILLHIPNYLLSFFYIHPRWLFGISSINSMTPTWGRFPFWLYNIFVMGWNHQLGMKLWLRWHLLQEKRTKAVADWLGHFEGQREVEMHDFRYKTSQNNVIHHFSSDPYDKEKWEEHVWIDLPTECSFGQKASESGTVLRCFFLLRGSRPLRTEKASRWMWRIKPLVGLPFISLLIWVPHIWWSSLPILGGKFSLAFGAALLVSRRFFFPVWGGSWEIKKNPR